MRRAGVCGLSVLQAGTECGDEQRVRMAVDCSLDHHMTHDRELKSVALQIKQAYFVNMRAPKPFQLYLTGLAPGSRIRHALRTHTPDYLTYNYQFEVREERHDSVFDPEDIIYLTPDSSHDLEEIEASKIYVLGGIVDLTINKRLTLHRARLAGLKTARLPISRYMEFSNPSPHNIDLPLGLVFHMLLDVYSGKDWPAVLDTHMPKRKGFKLKSKLFFQ